MRGREGESKRGRKRRVFDLSVKEDVRRELEFHVRSKIEELISAGFSAAEAESEAVRLFGDERQLAAECRAIVRSQRRRVRWSERCTSVLQDVRYGLRGLARDRGFTLVAILTLALGIGANTAVFTVIAGVLLRPLPYPEADRIVKVWEVTETGRLNRVAEANYVDWRAASGSFEAMAVEASGALTVVGGSEPVRRVVAEVGPSFFDVMRTQPVRGRAFGSGEAEPGSALVALVSERFWQDQLGGNSDLAALELGIGRDFYEVIGVMPAGFHYPSDADVWTPAVLDRGSSRTAHNWEVIARIKAEVPMADAQAELSVIGHRIRQEFGEEVDAVDVRLEGLQESLVGSFRRPLMLLLSAAFLVLLVGCTNLASALLARGGAREQEFAVRTSLGAGRGRLIRQMLTESLLISAIGGMAGLVIAMIAGRALVAMGPAILLADMPGRPDPVVLGFTALISIGSAMLFGGMPALRVSRADPGITLREAGRGNAGGARSHRWSVLIGAETALAVVLLVAAGLLTRSFRNVMAVDPGFDADRVATADFALPQVVYPDETAIRSWHARIMPLVRALPGVDVAGYINHLPLGGMAMNGALEIEGVGDAPGSADYRVVSDDYFASMGIPIRAGRDFDPLQEGQFTAPAAIVNEAFVRTLLSPGTMPDNAIGMRIRNLRNESWYYDPEQWLTIVGVVGDVRHGGPLSEPDPEVYVHVLQRPIRAAGGFLTVKTRGPANGAALRAAVQALDPNVPVEVSTLEARSAQVLAGRRFGMLVLAAFAGLALALGAIGIYGVVSYSVERRRREMGVRLALGATVGDVVGRTVRRALVAVAAGLAVGVPAAIAVATLLRGMLFGVEVVDGATLSAVIAVLFGVGLLACWIPARRLAAIDPVATLRAD